MNILDYHFEFPPDFTEKNNSLFVAYSPVWHSLLALRRVMELRDDLRIDLIYNHEEIISKKTDNVIQHYYDSKKLDVSCLSSESIESIRGRKIENAILAHSGSLGDYRNVFRMLAQLSIKNCYGINENFFFANYNWNLERYYPFKLGLHTVTSCIGVNKDESIYLYELARYGLGKGQVVEIGSWTGGSSVALALGSNDSERGGIYAVDVNFHCEYERNLESDGVLDLVHAYQMSSREMALNWLYITKDKESHIRLLWIDGDHSYESVSNDILYWQDFLEPGGVICLHDYSENHPGVIRAVYEQIVSTGKYKDFKIANLIFSAVKK